MPTVLEVRERASSFLSEKSVPAGRQLRVLREFNSNTALLVTCTLLSCYCDFWERK